MSVMPLTFEIKPVRGTNLVNATVQRLRGLVEQGGLKSGDRLPGEHELAGRLNVSRSVVREAIGRLQTIGLLTVERGRKGGTFVSEQDAVRFCADVVRSSISLCDSDINEFAGFRIALETFSARRAAELATVEDIAELQSLCDAPAQCTDDDELVQVDLRFHRKIAAVAGNEIILNTLEVSREFIAAMIRESGPNDLLQNYDEHQSIVDSIRRHDSAAAERAMRDHLESVMRCLSSSHEKK